MGFRDWLPGGGESPLETADRLRGEALENPGSVDVEQLVALHLDADRPDVCRAATKGITTIAEQAPAQLADVVPQLLDGTMVIEDVGAKQRGDLATAVEAVAREDPDAVMSHADLVVKSLEIELEADDAPGTDVRLYEEKAAALARTAGRLRIERAESVLEKLKRHHHHEVSDAARDAIRQL